MKQQKVQPVISKSILWGKKTYADKKESLKDLFSVSDAIFFRGQTLQK